MGDMHAHITQPVAIITAANAAPTVCGCRRWAIPAIMVLVVNLIVAWMLRHGE